MNMQEIVAYEVLSECPDCSDLHLLDEGTATRAELAQQQADIPANAAVRIRIYTIH